MSHGHAFLQTKQAGARTRQSPTVVGAHRGWVPNAHVQAAARRSRHFVHAVYVDRSAPYMATATVIGGPKG